MKNNNKQHRTDGAIESNGIKMPDQSKSFNTPTSHFTFNEKDQINSKQTRKC